MFQTVFFVIGSEIVEYTLHLCSLDITALINAHFKCKTDRINSILRLAKFRGLLFK